MGTDLRQVVHDFDEPFSVCTILNPLFPGLLSAKPYTWGWQVWVDASFFLSWSRFDQDHGPCVMPSESARTIFVARWGPMIPTSVHGIAWVGQQQLTQVRWHVPGIEEPLQHFCPARGNSFVLCAIRYVRPKIINGMLVNVRRRTLRMSHDARRRRQPDLVEKRRPSPSSALATLQLKQTTYFNMSDSEDDPDAMNNKTVDASRDHVQTFTEDPSLTSTTNTSSTPAVPLSSARYSWIPFLWWYVILEHLLFRICDAHTRFQWSCDGACSCPVLGGAHTESRAGQTSYWRIRRRYSRDAAVHGNPARKFCYSVPVIYESIVRPGWYAW